MTDYNGIIELDPAHTAIGFIARHAMVTKVRGAFNEVTGAATTGPGLEGARIEIDVVAESVDQVIREIRDYRASIQMVAFQMDRGQYRPPTTTDLQGPEDASVVPFPSREER